MLSTNSSCPRMAPAANSTVWVSAKKPGGLASIWASVKLEAVSAASQRENHTQSQWCFDEGDGSEEMAVPPLARSPVVKGPFIQPNDVRRPNSSRGASEVGLGKANRGGPARPYTASC